MTRPRRRALGPVLVALLLADAALGWMAVQASLVFLELVWRAVAGRDNYRPLLDAHVRQFAALRAVDALALAATAAAFPAWLSGVRTALREGGRLVSRASWVRPLRMMLETWRATVPGAPASGVPAMLGWWWAALLATLGAKVWAAAHLLGAGRAMHLGPGLQLTIVGGALQVALAALTIFVVLAVQRGLPAERGPRP